MGHKWSDANSSDLGALCGGQSPKWEGFEAVKVTQSQLSKLVGLICLSLLGLAWVAMAAWMMYVWGEHSNFLLLSA